MINGRVDGSDKLGTFVDHGALVCSGSICSKVTTLCTRASCTTAGHQQSPQILVYRLIIGQCNSKRHRYPASVDGRLSSLNPGLPSIRYAGECQWLAHHQIADQAIDCCCLSPTRVSYTIRASYVPSLSSLSVERSIIYS